MVTLFSQEKLSEIHDYNIAQNARNEERLINLKLMIENLGLSAVQALDALRVADEDRPAYLELLSSP